MARGLVLRLSTSTFDLASNAAASTAASYDAKAAKSLHATHDVIYNAIYAQATVDMLRKVISFVYARAKVYACCVRAAQPLPTGPGHAYHQAVIPKALLRQSMRK